MAEISKFERESMRRYAQKTSSGDYRRDLPRLLDALEAAEADLDRLARSIRSAVGRDLPTVPDLIGAVRDLAALPGIVADEQARVRRSRADRDEVTAELDQMRAERDEAEKHRDQILAAAHSDHLRMADIAAERDDAVERRRSAEVSLSTALALLKTANEQVDEFHAALHGTMESEHDEAMQAWTERHPITGPVALSSRFRRVRLEPWPMNPEHRAEQIRAAMKKGEVK